MTTTPRTARTVRTEPPASPASDAAAALLTRLVEGGLQHIVLSPGSRSQALALVAAELERRGEISLHVRIDERVAGFTALGIGRESAMPAAVVCTSGTATANLLPAVMEADHAGVPLLLLTADRPPELRGIGANQTTRQAGMYAAHARWSTELDTPSGADGELDAARAAADEAMDAALGRGAAAGAPCGPVHLNLPYREPLSGESKRGPGVVSTRSARGATESSATFLPRGPRTLVVAGADAGPAAEQLAHDGGWPLVAEVVSGSRFGRNLVHGYRALLRDPDLGGRVERVAVFGHPTLSREVTALLQRTDVTVVAVRGPGEQLNLNGATEAAASLAVEPGETDRTWLGAWMRASHAARVEIAPPAPDRAGMASAVPAEHLAAISAEVAALRMPLDREVLVDAVWRATWPHDRLVFGSSRLVRVADALVPGKKVPVHANRGLAGIDGTIATATGVALASTDPGTTRVLLGDLTLLHDVGALLLPDDEPAPRLQLIVGNDGGGTIFDGLEVASTAGDDTMRRVMYTPQAVDLAALAAAYGWEFQRVTTRSALDQALSTVTARPVIIEVPLDR
ncbi:2-succinyl-5-enolpyruvyl-6-hydroxy-3-cyclohexene-1-carboxylic-acid synthase [Microbacterium horticulturae]|uniref:2-succinyl-5-enolpyruvyl-6-hydroxy-3-cyclohexene-1-carboxylate synthase n=1 Tax=Microbacterium horticulturae TaxID=3028316 RepID=A0ABY8BZM3_9MICO|nr:2-succinyl-5-enolpyruvyl-6-hydroxy-3-cyclohexene-1-carboxylic-acid synthase [Microbacterium sp. KACC 23027]WEG09655.1 2-succinyl-5-enolpyruvyl-6-hydroxy-3-cyclohexene-1-carboxylic-acid synthase [Microbacterium sp. KACC 23027]